VTRGQLISRSRDIMSHCRFRWELGHVRQNFCHRHIDCNSALTLAGHSCPTLLLQILGVNQQSLRFLFSFSYLPPWVSHRTIVTSLMKLTTISRSYVSMASVAIKTKKSESHTSSAKLDLDNFGTCWAERYLNKFISGCNTHSTKADPSREEASQHNGSGPRSTASPLSQLNFVASVKSQGL
jgi:hypothetical protein